MKRLILPSIGHIKKYPGAVINLGPQMNIILYENSKIYVLYYFLNFNTYYETINENN